MQKLTPKEVARRLAALTGWTADDGALQKTFPFADYYRVMAFVNAVAFVAHATNHHPDLAVHYRTVHARFTTHDAGGLTALDFASAERVEQLSSLRG